MSSENGFDTFLPCLMNVQLEPKIQANIDRGQHEENDPGACGGWGQYLPTEVLLRIFREAIKPRGPVPVLCRAARVCRRWNEVSSAPELWKILDLSSGWIPRSHAGIQMLSDLCCYKVQHTEVLNLTAWLSMSDRDLQMICESCPRLETLILCHCSSLTPAGLQAVADTCTNLRDLDISVLSAGAAGKKVLLDLLTKRGAGLRRLNIAYNLLYDSVFYDVMTRCPNLEGFQISEENAYYCVDIERFQHCVPSMKVLKLGSTNIKGTNSSAQEMAFSPGWPELKVFEVPKNASEDLIARVLKTSTKLEVLNALSARESFPHVPVNNLKELLVSKHNPLAYLRQLPRWQHSLEEVDFSWLTKLTRHALDQILNIVFSPEKQYVRLRFINLAGSPVSCHGLCPILQRCPSLTYINLSMCKRLPLGWSVEFKGRDLGRLYKLAGVTDTPPRKPAADLPWLGSIYAPSMDMF